MIEFTKDICGKLRLFPKQIILIVGNEFCERFTFYGIKTILILYLTIQLGLNRNSATAVYHGFSAVCYYAPILGGIMADGYFGKYNTILGMSILYGCGNIILSLTAIPALGAPELAGPMVGLFTIAIATGGIKPNICAFGGDQFTSTNVHLRNSFFSIFYFAINTGALFSTFFTPMLRANVSCFGQTTCYSLAFGVPAMLMALAILLFVIGTPLYIRYPPKGNIVGEFCSCIAYALKVKFKTPSHKRKKEHWLQYAEEKYTSKQVGDFRATLRVLLVFLPISVFWCLINQQGSTWTLQAEEMNGKLGNMVLEPDQMQVLNPIFILMLIPVFDFVIYPLLNRCGIPNRPLQRITAGMVLTTLAYVIAGFVQIVIDNHAVKFPGVGHSSFSISNLADENCSLLVTTYKRDEVSHQPFKMPLIHFEKESKRKIVTSGNYSLFIKPMGDRCLLGSIRVHMTLNAKQSFLLIAQKSRNKLNLHSYKTSCCKPKKGTAMIRFANFLPKSNASNYLMITGGKIRFKSKLSDTKQLQKYRMIHPKYHHMLTIYQTIKHKNVTKYTEKLLLLNGAVYTDVIMQKSSGIVIHAIKDVAENSVSMLLQVPQYFIIESAEILVSVTGLTFAYSQAPHSMKSVVMAGWFLTGGLGDTIVIIWAVIKDANRHNNHHEAASIKFFMFAGIMAATAVLFAIMSHFYTYVTDTDTILHESTTDNVDGHDVKEAKDSTPLLQ